MGVITLLGLGEAGRLYAEGLASAGQAVRAYDPFVTVDSETFQQADELSDALADAELVISLVGARASESVAAQAMDHLRSGVVFADFNTAAPSVKAKLADAAATVGALFADVAVLAPVPRAGYRTPIMASGSGADALHDALAPLGVPIESIGGAAGDAAGRKLLRSVFMKGLAGVVLETLRGSQAIGAEEWAIEQMSAELGPDGRALIERLVTGSQAHAARRAHEMQDTIDYLNDLGAPSWMAAGARRWLKLYIGEK